MLQAINICNQPASVTQLLPNPAWPIEPANFRCGYPVHPNPELQTGSTSLVESSVAQQVSSNLVLYRAVHPFMVPVSNSPPLMGAHGPDIPNYIYLLPFPSSDNASAAITFTENLIQTGRINIYATDKRGSRFLQKVVGDKSIRQKLAGHFFKMDIFVKLCDDIFANFFFQKLIEGAKSNEREQEAICSILRANMVIFSLGRYSCRVVQKALDCFSVANCLSIVDKLKGSEENLTMDQNGNHVIQKVFSCVPFKGYRSIIRKYMVSTNILSELVKDKYGCRVIQLSIEKLEQEVAKNSIPAINLLDRLISMLIENCYSYSSHQYANYVIQHIIASDKLENHRNTIICKLLSNLLSMSQEKYASHVVEKALRYAPPELLHAMMSEIFDGYECDTKGHDAVDVLLFDQFGNYVIQTMLDVAVKAKKGEHGGNNFWFERLAERIITTQHKLIRYSSGKKILEKLSAAVSNNKNMIQDENFGSTLKSLVVPKKFR